MLTNTPRSITAFLSQLDGAIQLGDSATPETHSASSLQCVDGVEEGLGNCVWGIEYHKVHVSKLVPVIKTENDFRESIVNRIPVLSCNLDMASPTYLFGVGGSTSRDEHTFHMWAGQGPLVDRKANSHNEDRRRVVWDKDLYASASANCEERWLLGRCSAQCDFIIVSMRQKATEDPVPTLAIRLDIQLDLLR